MENGTKQHLNLVRGCIHFRDRVVAPDVPEVARRDPAVQQEAPRHLGRAGPARVEQQRRVCGRVACVGVLRVDFARLRHVLRGEDERSNTALHK